MLYWKVQKKNFKIQEEYKKQNKPVPETLKKKNESYKG